MKFKLPNLAFIAKLRPLWRYRLIIFIVFIAGLSGYLVLQLNTAINIAPSSSVDDAKITKTPRIDPVLVQKLQSLQDNSVEVKSLFNEARQNPFQ